MTMKNFDGAALTAGISFPIAVIATAFLKLSFSYGWQPLGSAGNISAFFGVVIGLIFAIGFGFVALVRRNTPTRIFLSLVPTVFAICIVYVALKND